MSVPCAILIGLAVALAGTRANADAPLGARLVYFRSPGTTHCPSQLSLRSALAVRLGRDLFVSRSNATIVATTSRSHQGLNARIELRAADGSLTGSRTLRTTDAGCAELARAMVLAIAIAVDPLSFIRIPVAARPPVALRARRVERTQQQSASPTANRLPTLSIGSSPLEGVDATHDPVTAISIVPAVPVMLEVVRIFETPTPRRSLELTLQPVSPGIVAASQGRRGSGVDAPVATATRASNSGSNAAPAASRPQQANGPRGNSIGFDRADAATLRFGLGPALSTDPWWGRAVGTRVYAALDLRTISVAAEVQQAVHLGTQVGAAMHSFTQIGLVACSLRAFGSVSLSLCGLLAARTIGDAQAEAAQPLQWTAIAGMRHAARVAVSQSLAIEAFSEVYTALVPPKSSGVPLGAAMGLALVSRFP